MFRPFSPSSGKSFYINTPLFLLLFLSTGECLQFLKFRGQVMCVIYILPTVIHMQA
jgi:hypothetical protein